MEFPFTKNGFDHELIEREDRVCLVRRTKGGRQEHYEVVMLQWNREHAWPNGDVTPAGWSYPSNEQWGSMGWTYTDIRMARFHYGEALKRASAPLAV